MMKNRVIITALLIILGVILYVHLGDNKEGFTSSDVTNNIEQGFDDLEAGADAIGRGVEDVVDDIGSSVTSTNTTAGITSTTPPDEISYDNYNYYKKSYSPTTYYGPSGTKAQVISFDGAYAIMMHNSNGETTLYKLDPPAENTNTSTSSTRQLQNTVIPIDDNMLNQSLSDQENGGNAKIMKGNNGRYVVEIVLPDGLASLFTEDNVYTYNPANSPSVGSDGVSYKQPYTNLGEDAPPRQGVQPPPRHPSDIYLSLLPQGVPRSQIPPGEEDMYILKTEVIPPVCPKCPSACSSESSKSSSKCPPCPACARCPESKFECEKVPVYPQHANSNSSQQNSEYSYSSMMGPLTNSNSGSSSGSSSNTGSSSTNTGSSSTSSGSSSTSSGSSSTSSNQGGSADSVDYKPLPTLNSFSAFGM